ncbi:MAG: dephospho-CoA kinase [Actinomycetota bacterium]
MLLVGLTGGIASGKSTVAKMLADRGAVVIDADLIAREIVEPGQEAYQKIVEHFGPDVLQLDKRIDREKLGRIVFNDPAKRVLLNELTHPRVMRIIADRLEELRESDVIVVCDIPLMVEAGTSTGGFDLIVVVDTMQQTQVERLARDRGMGADDALARIGSQASADERRALADVVIDNEGDLASLEEQVDELWTRLVLMRESK